MKVDITTRKAVRIKYARACVEMQLNQPLKMRLTIYGGV